MEPENKGNERLPKESFADLKIRIDNLIKSPEERAGEIYKLIENEEMQIWDIVCFCMVFINRSTMMFEFLKPLAKEFHTLIYLAHYKSPEELGILNQRKDEKVQMDNKQRD